MRDRSRRSGQLSFFGEDPPVDEPQAFEPEPEPPTLEDQPPELVVAVAEAPEGGTSVAAETEPELEPAPQPARRRRRSSRSKSIQRIQTGVRLEERFLRVAKAVAEAKGTTLGRLTEQLVLHAFADVAIFAEADRQPIEHFRQAYGLAEEKLASDSVKRVQAGILLETRLLKVLKATALMVDRDVAELLEDIGLSAFAGRPAFSGECRRHISEFARIYGMELPLEPLGSGA